MAPSAEEGGAGLAAAVEEFLSHDENLPNNANVTRLTLEDGSPLPFGHVMDRLWAELSTGERQVHSFIFGGLVEITEWGLFDTYALIMFNPDNPDDISAGGQVLTFRIFDDNDSAGLMTGVTIRLIEDNGMRNSEDNTPNDWIRSGTYDLHSKEFIDLLQAGFSGERDLFGSQGVVSLQVLENGYAGAGGWIEENTDYLDGNNDGVSDPGVNGYMIIQGSIPIAIPNSVFDSELKQQLVSLSHYARE